MRRANRSIFSMSDLVVAKQKQVENGGTLTAAASVDTEAVFWLSATAAVEYA